MNKYSKTIIIILALFLFTTLIQIGHPWQRQPNVFYEPLILPVELIDGDILVTKYGQRIDIKGNQRINSIQTYGDRVVINSTKHLTLLELILSK